MRGCCCSYGLRSMLRLCGTTQVLGLCGPSRCMDIHISVLSQLVGSLSPTSLHTGAALGKRAHG